MAMLSTKVALITGASAPNGIGRAIAHRLSEHGASVVITDIGGELHVDGNSFNRTELLQSLAQEINTNGGSALALTLDVTSERDIEQCIASALNTYSKIDILVNNAGTTIGADQFLNTTAEQWEASFRVNILGPMMLSKAVVPQMRANGGGRIVNIGSIGSLGAEAGFGAYTTMKHGLAGMTKTLAAEFGSDGILCNTICPGYISTDMHMSANKRLAAKNNLTVEEMKKQRYEKVAVKKAGTPQDVADAVVYLAGPGSDYVTGINLPVSGGVPFGI